MACCSSGCILTYYCSTVQWNNRLRDTVRNRTYVDIRFFFLRMTGTTTSENIDLSSLNILYMIKQVNLAVSPTCILGKYSIDSRLCYQQCRLRIFFMLFQWILSPSLWNRLRPHPCRSLLHCNLCYSSRSYDVCNRKKHLYSIVLSSEV
jgi:hypothetical protein